MAVYCRTKLNYVVGEEVAPTEVEIQDGRAAGPFSLHEHGFELRHHRSALTSRHYLRQNNPTIVVYKALSGQSIHATPLPGVSTPGGRGRHTAMNFKLVQKHCPTLT